MLRTAETQPNKIRMSCPNVPLYGIPYSGTLIGHLLNGFPLKTCGNDGCSFPFCVTSVIDLKLSDAVPYTDERARGIISLASSALYRSRFVAVAVR